MKQKHRDLLTRDGRKQDEGFLTESLLIIRSSGPGTLSQLQRIALVPGADLLFCLSYQGPS